MSYVQGFVVAVPTANKSAYIAYATAAMPLFKEFGAGRMVEGWGDDVPDGRITDFKRAVQANTEESVLFSWVEFADKATCDAAGEKMMSDPRMGELGEMPFDGRRMIFGGFGVVLDEGPGGEMGYLDGFLVPVPADRKDAYFSMARTAAQVFLDHGATRVVEGWGENIPEGKVTDFNRATSAVEGEKVVFSWVEWPSKKAREVGQVKVTGDERMKMSPADMPFDHQRVIYGGFAPVFDQ